MGGDKDDQTPYVCTGGRERGEGIIEKPTINN